MKKTMKISRRLEGRFTVSLLLILFILAFSGIEAVPASAPAGEPIKIGLIDSFVGSAVRFGKDCAAGAQIAVKETNEMGGVLGRPVEVIIRDDKLKVEQALRNAKELIDNEKCIAIIGIFSSGIALQLSDWAKKNQTLVLGYNCRSQRLTEEFGHKYWFRSSSNTVMDGRNSARFLLNKPWKKWALLGGDYEYGHAQCDAFKEEMLKLKPGTEFVAAQWPKLGETDYTPVITALMAVNPEAIYSALPGSDGVGFIKQATAFGFFKKIIYVGNHEGGLASLEPMGPNIAEGLYLSCNYSHLYKPDLPENKSFIDRTKKETGNYPSDYHFLGYVGMKMLIAGIKKAGKTDTEALVKALEGISIISPLGEPITMRALDHQSDMGMIFGVTAKDPKYPDYLILKDTVYVPGAPAMRSAEEIKAIRGEK